MAKLTFNKLKRTEAIWLPQIPIHWELVKVRHLFKESTKKGFPNETLLVASQEHGVVSKDAYGKRTVEATKDLQNLKLVDKGDFVISLRSFQGGIEVAHERGIISPAYTVMKERRLIEKRYFKNLFKSPPFISLMTLCVKGIREGQNIDYPTFKNEHLPLPPLKEQQAISVYLDKKNNEIDKFIRNKERLIELLEASKKSKIFDAITKGLNRNVEQKESGFAWIGSMPKHWGLNKIKSFANHVQRGSSPTYVNESELVVISQASMSSGFIDETKFKYQTKAKIETFKGRLFPNDVLLASTGGGVLGKAIVFEREGNYIADGHLTIIRDKKKRFNPKFLYYFLSINFDFIEGYLGQGSTNQTELQRGWFRDLYLPFPMLKEQNEIVVFIDEFCKEINSAISKAEKEISSIKEYREALITDLVTGKRSVPQLQMD
jgi:type I restriction enzyme S subunit